MNVIGRTVDGRILVAIDAAEAVAMEEAARMLASTIASMNGDVIVDMVIPARTNFPPAILEGGTYKAPATAGKGAGTTKARRGTKGARQAKTAKAGRIGMCKKCGNGFDAKASGPLPTLCPVCRDPQTTAALGERTCRICSKTFKPHRKDQHVCAPCSRAKKGGKAGKAAAPKVAPKAPVAPVAPPPPATTGSRLDRIRQIDARMNGIAEGAMAAASEARP